MNLLGVPMHIVGGPIIPCIFHVHTGYVKLTWTLPSWDLPADVEMEDAWYYLTPNNVHGDFKEVHLDICITKLNVDH